METASVLDFGKTFELYDLCTVVFSFGNKHIETGLGTGNTQTH